MGGRFYRWEGLQRISLDLDGTESIMLGCRPYGFHAGNMLAMVAYPYALASLVAQRGVVPRFTFNVTYNDIELVNPWFYSGSPFCLERWDRTTIQCSPDPGDCCKSLAEHWQKFIKTQFDRIREDFPSIQLNFTPTSEMLSHKRFTAVLESSIQDPEHIAQFISEVCGYQLIPGKIAYAGAVCPRCNIIDGETHIMAHSTRFRCHVCETDVEGEFDGFSYWMNHLPLGVAKEAYQHSDIWISGGDYLGDNVYDVYGALAHDLDIDTFSHITHLMTPVVLGSDSKPMHKSSGNSFEVPFDLLLHAAATSPETELTFRSVRCGTS